MKILLLAIFLACPGYAGQVGSSDPGAIGVYHFNEGTGSTSLNSTQNTAGSITSAAWVAGKIGPGLYFSGAAGNRFENNTSYPLSLNNTNNSITILAWIKPSSTGTQRYLQIGGTWNYVFLIQALSQKWRWLIYANGNYFDRQSDSTFSTGVWYFIAVTSNGVAPKLYVNGIQQSGGSGGSVPTSALVGYVIVGSGYNSGLGTFNEPATGYVDEVAIYNRAMTSGEIMKIYRENLGRFRNAN